MGDSHKTYDEIVFDGLSETSEENEATLRELKKAALCRAHDIRKFEIELYWRRNLYFWGFNVVIFAGFGVLTQSDCCRGAPVSQTGAIGLALLGLFIAIAWFYMSRGAKAWQENWEQHVFFLEDHLTGRLTKTRLGDQQEFFSVTKINKTVIVIIGLFWFLLAELLIAAMIWPDWGWDFKSLAFPHWFLVFIPFVVFGLAIWWADRYWRTGFDAGGLNPLFLNQDALRPIQDVSRDRPQTDDRERHADRDHADVIKHMEMIQNVISRLADNSFKIKQWSLISLAAIFTIFGTLNPDTPKDNPEAAAKLFSVPWWIILGFFLLNTYSTYLERCYRKKFDDVRQQEETDFDMSLIPLWREGIIAFFSWSNCIFYSLIFLIYIFGLVMFVNFGIAK